MYFLSKTYQKTFVQTRFLGTTFGTAKSILHHFPKKLSLFFLFSPFILSQNALQAQEQLGLRLDNYAGANAIMLNPAANATCKFSWDVNLVAGGFWFGNNVAYLDGASVGKAIRAARDNRIGPDPALKLEFKGQADLRFNFYDEKFRKFVSTGGFVQGPSVVINLESGHSFGFFTQFRSAFASQNLPRIVNYYEFKRQEQLLDFEIDPFKGATMAWAEIGVNYARNFGSNTEGGLTIGGSIKYLQGFQGFYGENAASSRARRLSQDSLRVEAFRGETGFTTNYTEQSPSVNGSGAGIDLGMVLTLPSDDNDKPYSWRLGGSLLDLGRVYFSKNAEVHGLILRDPIILSKEDFENLDPNDPREDAFNRLNQEVLGKIDSTQKGSSFAIGLPTALSLQADYAFTKEIFFNATLIQRLATGKSALGRDNLLALTPRYETRWLGASLPISIYNWQQVRVGLAARLAFLTIGTDHLFSWISNGELTGTDFYFALKINPFNIGRIGGGGNGGRGGKKGVGCYKF